MSLSKSNLFCRVGVDNYCQHRRGSRVAHATSAELGDVRDQAVTRRLLAATEDKIRLMWAEFERGDIFSSSMEAEELST